jgi:DnaJ family protein C protein 3
MLTGTQSTVAPIPSYHFLSDAHLTSSFRLLSHPPTFPLKQCLHVDPDSPSCLPAHRLAKSLDKGFSKLTKLMEANDWKGVLKHVVGSAKDFPGDGFARTFEASLLENGTPDMLAPSSSKLPLPNVLSTSPRRAFILHAACRAYLKLNVSKKGEPWCDELIAMSEDTLRALSDMGGDTNAEVDAWVVKGEAMLLREEWEEAVRVFERAFESSGRSDRDVSYPFLFECAGC